MWPTVKLGDVLKRSTATIEPQAETEYQEITVRLWGKGVVERGRALGASLTGRRFVAHSDQFIVSRIAARHGAMGLVPNALNSALVTNDFPLFDLNTKLLDPLFIAWLCRTTDFIELCSRASEGTTRVRLKEEQFLALEIPLPPLPEQRRIVARIEELAAQIQEARELRRKAVEGTEALVGVRAYIIFDETMKNGFMPLESVAVLERGKFSHRPRNEPRFFDGNHPWIQIGEIKSSNKYIRTWSQTLNNDGLAISKKFSRGTVLISIAATIGAVGILDFDCCVPDSIVGVTPKQNTDSEFLYHYLNYLRRHLEEIAPQSAQKNINLGILTQIPVPTLSFAEQRRIVAELDALQTQVDALKRLQSETAVELNALLPAVLDRAFKGEL
jgi:type I restriction enzyme S subunit